MSCYEPINTLDAKPLQALGPRQRFFVNSLKSGHFGQAKHRLKEDNGTFCALGVAAECAGVLWARGKNCFGDLCWGLNDEDGNFRSAILPESVDNFYSFVSSGRDIHALNDAGNTFERIAEMIESNPAKFFSSPK